MKTALLLVNLGSPDSASVPDVRRFLGEFLSDPLMIDIPSPPRWLLVRGVILPFRSAAVAATYRSVWMPEGAPLRVHSLRLKEKLQAALDLPVKLAMRYGSLSIDEALGECRAEKVEKLLVLFLYPHYALSTFESGRVAVERALKRQGFPLEPVWQPPYATAQPYVAALAESARPHLEAPFDHLLVSFHSLPERHIRKADIGHHCLARPDCCEVPHPGHAFCYRAQCLQSAKALADALRLPPEKWSVAWQSANGRKWLGPDLHRVVREMPPRGIKRLAVISPSFASDCIETLEELEIRAKRSFLEAGGAEFRYIPCLNDHPSWVKALAGFATKLAAC